MEVGHKNETYQRCLREITETLKGRALFEQMSEICSVLKKNIPYYFWVGFYIPKKSFLALGPSEGPPACSQIAYTGVCGEALKREQTVIVPNVDEFPGHIACDPRSKSEIVVPVFDKNGSVAAVLDVDSDAVDSFDEIDREWLEKIVKELR